MVNFPIKSAITAITRRRGSQTNGSTSRHPQSSFITLRRSSVPFSIDDAQPRIFAASFSLVISFLFGKTKSVCDFRYHDFRMVDHLRASAGRSLNRRVKCYCNTRQAKFTNGLARKSHKWSTSHTLKTIPGCFRFANDFSRPEPSDSTSGRSYANGRGENYPRKEKKRKKIPYLWSWSVKRISMSARRCPLRVEMILDWLNVVVGSFVAVFDGREVIGVIYLWNINFNQVFL